MDSARADLELQASAEQLARPIGVGHVRYDLTGPDLAELERRAYRLVRLLLAARPHDLVAVGHPVGVAGGWLIVLDRDRRERCACCRELHLVAALEESALGRVCLGCLAGSTVLARATA